MADLTGKLITNPIDYATVVAGTHPQFDLTTVIPIGEAWWFYNVTEYPSTDQQYVYKIGDGVRQLQNLPWRGVMTDADEDIYGDKNLKDAFTLETDLLGWTSVQRGENDFTGIAGWSTLLRTQENFSGHIHITAYGVNRKQCITLAVYGDEVAGDWDIGFIDQSQRGDDAVPGIYRLRWGDAGAGNGLCLQAYVDKGTDASIRVKIETYAAKPMDNNANAGFALGTYGDVQQDLDGNAVSTWTGDYYSFMFNSLVQINHRRYQDAEDIVVDGTVITELKPGVYKSVQFTGDATMRMGKYLVLGDFTIDATVTVDIETGSLSAVDAPNIEMFAMTYTECLFHGMTGYMKASGYTNRMDGLGRYGGGKGGSHTATAQCCNGGNAPCGNGAKWIGISDAGTGGGFIFLNVLGQFINNGTFQANGENAPVGTLYGGGGGAGGYIGIRAFKSGNTWGNINAEGGDGDLTPATDGGGGGGGLIECYAPETPNPTTDVTAGAGQSGQTAGNDWLINVLSGDHWKYWDEGGSDTVTDDEYLHAGKCIQIQGGWLP